jgi:hypothetical protein
MEGAMTKLIVEMEIEGKQQPETIEVADRSLEGLLTAVRAHAGLGDDVHVFEREVNDELIGNIGDRSAISISVSRCKRISVEIRFEHSTRSEKFPPSATIFRILRWATGKKAFDLDETAQAKASLILPGGESPLPRDATIGRFLDGASCALAFDLTLRDFTNGR